jgi:LacI family transcriptional regulator
MTSIAREAGVSVPTVSRVLNGRSDVAPETRERVEELLRRHGYRRRTGRTQGPASLVDLVFHDLDSPWAVEIIRGVEEVAHAACVGTVLSATHRKPAAVSQWLDNVRARSTDGVILVTSDARFPLHADLRRLRVPAVVIDPSGVPAGGVTTVGAADWSGALAATEHLLGLGHKRIGYIAGPRNLVSSRSRLDAFRAGLEAAGLGADEELIAQGDFSHESGYSRAGALLDLPRRPTALFASSDQMALGAYKAVRERGLRIPEDVSVVGFDDLPDVRWSVPPLTTVRQPLSAMGALAARTLLRLAAGEKIESLRYELGTELVVRESSGPAPGTERG